MAKQVMDIRPGKGFTYAQSNEHLRIAAKGAYEQDRSVNMNPSREHLNFEVTRGGKIIPVNKRKSIPLRIKENLKRRGITDPNEGKEIPTRRTVANVILQGSRERMLELAFGTSDIDLAPNADNSHLVRQKGIEEWAIDMYVFMAKKFGEDNIAAFIVHLDETNPHVHCTLLPVTERNKISYKTVLHAQDKQSARDFMLKLHDELSKVNTKYGLERGESVEKTGAKHRTTEQYRQWLNEERDRLEKESNSVRQENEKTRRETANISEQNRTVTEIVKNKWKQVEKFDREIAEKEQKISSQKQELYNLNAELKKAETRIKGLSTMIKNLEARKDEVEEQIANLEHDLENGEISMAEMNQRKAVLDKELKRIISDISDKTDKLIKAKEDLREITHKKNERSDEYETMRKQYDHMQKEMSKEMPDYLRQTISKMYHTLFSLTSEEAKTMEPLFQRFRESLQPEDRSDWDRMLEETFIGKIIGGAEDTLACAVSLAIGAYSDALSYAMSKGGGGGGGSSLSKWGRDKDEDDDAWNRRCLFAGMRMLRPAPGRRLKR